MIRQQRCIVVRLRNIENRENVHKRNVDIKYYNIININ